MTPKIKLDEATRKLFQDAGAKGGASVKGDKKRRIGAANGAWKGGKAKKKAKKKRK